VKADPRPKPTTVSMKIMPTQMPNRCGTVRRNPKFTPEASSMVLFGPGVIDDTSTKAQTRSTRWNRASYSTGNRKVHGNTTRQEIQGVRLRTLYKTVPVQLAGKLPILIVRPTPASLDATASTRRCA
jgi:hypothetical protein